MFYAVESYAHEAELLALFQSQNTDIAEVEILEYASNANFEGGLLVARGMKRAREFTGNFRDELFGVFYTEKNMKNIKALDYIPTKRWFDYCVDISKITIGHFKVRFYGCTYNDQELIREYSMGANF